MRTRVLSSYRERRAMNGLAGPAMRRISRSSSTCRSTASDPASMAFSSRRVSRIQFEIFVVAALTSPATCTETSESGSSFHSTIAIASIGTSRRRASKIRW